MKKLPLTNKDKWHFEHGKYSLRFIEGDTNYEMFWLFDTMVETIDDLTLHYHRVDNMMEGIKIRWEGNPFNFNVYGNTHSKVYSYKDELPNN